MISDAFVSFTCDQCGETEQVTPPVIYGSYAGKDPHIDLLDSALEACLPQGWGIIYINTLDTIGVTKYH